ncbi:hypothetical protein PC118_g6357 [Phytophthora cactorum]|nr:hypothetical protein PC113_g11080 [Phytophthora cactorum]KAG2989091.1 hypothetical protein PC118_g6357 [Phytophthora cactorum]
MGVANVFNNFCSGTYAALIDNMFMLGPNSVEFIQLVLTFIYRTKTPDLIEDVGDEGSFSGVVFPPDQQPKDSSTEFVAGHLLR